MSETTTRSIECDDSMTKGIRQYGRNAVSSLRKLMQLVMPKGILMDEQDDAGECAHNCSGHGECRQGVCVCEVMWTGPFLSLVFFVCLKCFAKFIRWISICSSFSIAQVEFSGIACDNPNISYHLAFSAIFFVLCAISFTQLVSKSNQVVFQ